MNLGDAVTVVVDANDPWNRTGIHLNAGQIYSFRVPERDRWKDAQAECSADGYFRWYLAPFHWFRRVPRANWFALIGIVAHRTADPIIIGSCLSAFKPAHSGELMCFANDIRWMYWNNSGVIKLTVRRIG